MYTFKREYLKMTLVWVSTLLHRPPQLSVVIIIIIIISHHRFNKWHLKIFRRKKMLSLHFHEPNPSMQHANPDIQCVPEKRKPINQVNFSENCNDLSEKDYQLVIRCIGHAWPSTSHFKWWCQNWFAQNRNLRFNGVCHVWEQRDVLKRHSMAFVLSLLSCFFCLDSLFWHGLVCTWSSTQHHYSAKIAFDMHEFKLFLFSHASRYHHVFGIKWKKRKCPW